jgi:type VI protein secretion system component Hcp
MTKVSKSTVVVTIALAFVFAGSGVAFAGGKGGGGSSGPKSNTSLNFTKLQTTYAQQSAAAKASKPGKVKFNEFTIKKTTDQASPY